MFFTTYKNSLKTLLRSKTLLLSVLLVIFVAIYEAHGVHYSKFSLELWETIMDTDPRYVLEFDIFRQHIQNACIADIMWYALPLLAVISTALILSRDWGDRFFEIEKAAGKRPFSYMSARLCAILTVNVVVMTVGMMLSFYYYVFSRGGVEGMTTFAMIADSFPRIFKYVLFIGMPCIMMYVGLTYVVGNLLKSGIAGAAAGMGHVVGFYVFYLFFSAQQKFPIYFDYLAPIPKELRQYVYSFDMVYQSANGTPFWKAAIGFGVLVGAALIYYAVSYWRVRRREY